MGNEKKSLQRRESLVYSDTRISFSIDKWATGVRFSLLDLLTTWVWNGPAHPDQHWGCQLSCAKSSSSTALLVWPRVSPVHHSSTKNAPQERQFQEKKKKKRCWSSMSYLFCDFFRAGDIPSQGQRCLTTENFGWQWKLEPGCWSQLTSSTAVKNTNHCKIREESGLWKQALKTLAGPEKQ